MGIFSKHIKKEKEELRKIKESEKKELEDLKGGNNEDEEDEEGEDEEDDSEEDKYIISVSCKNCEEEYDFEIPKGTMVRDFLENKICKHCGCDLILEE